MAKHDCSLDPTISNSNTLIKKGYDFNDYMLKVLKEISILTHIQDDKHYFR